MSKNIKKAIFYFSGILLLSAGINIAKIAGLGISPISSLPYAIELIWGIEFALANLVFYCIMVLLQIVILNKNYKPIQLLQIGCSFAFSWFITITGAVVTAYLPEPSHYPIALTYCLIGGALIALGVAMYLVASWVPLPAEGLIGSVVQVSKEKVKFHQLKVALDVSLVCTAAVLSVVYLGELAAVREGTVIHAVGIGILVGAINRKWKQGWMEWVNK